MTVAYLSGIAYLPQDHEPHATWRVPNDPIPLTVNYHPEHVIGVAFLMRDEDGVIHAKARVPLDTLSEIHRQWLADSPVFAIGIHHWNDPERAVVNTLAVTGANEDERIPAYERTDEDD